MKATNALVTALIALVALQTGWILASWLVPAARADDPVQVTLTDSDGDASAYPGRLLCRTFPVTPEETIALPGEGPAGAWVREQGASWQLYTVDLEIGQKQTGFPQQWMQVCLYPR